LYEARQPLRIEEFEMPALHDEDVLIKTFACAALDAGRWQAGVKGIEVVLDLLAKENPKAKSLTVQQLFDPRFTSTN
jgi:hypothetical protein